MRPVCSTTNRSARSPGGCATYNGCSKSPSDRSLTPPVPLPVAGAPPAPGAGEDAGGAVELGEVPPPPPHPLSTTRAAAIESAAHLIQMNLLTWDAPLGTAPLHHLAGAVDAGLGWLAGDRDHELALHRAAVAGYRLRLPLEPRRDLVMHRVGAGVDGRHPPDGCLARARVDGAELEGVRLRRLGARRGSVVQVLGRDARGEQLRVPVLEDPDRAVGVGQRRVVEAD